MDERFEDLSPRRVAVTGATRWTDRELVERTLDRASAHARIVGASFQVFTGTAEGADQFAKDWAVKRRAGLFAANLDEGNYPGPMHRYNAHLLSLGPDLVLAFKQDVAANWRDKTCVAGTEHLCRIAAGAGIPVVLNGDIWLQQARRRR